MPDHAERTHGSKPISQDEKMITAGSIRRPVEPSNLEA
jgi:hypothetical protein